MLNSAKIRLLHKLDTTDSIQALNYLNNNYYCMKRTLEATHIFLIFYLYLYFIVSMIYENF